MTALPLALALLFGTPEAAPQPVRLGWEVDFLQE